MSDTQQSTTREKQLNPWMTPIAIIIAGVIIGGALLFSGVTPANGPEQENRPTVTLSEDDHILGNPEHAVLTIIEYSDIECQFCKKFHFTAHALSEAYGEDIALAFRHFPIDSLHRNARTEAEATECVAELAGNDAFWTYLDTLFERTTSNDGLDLALLPDIAEEVGVDREAFTSCLESDRYGESVTSDEEGGKALGIGGTPYSIFLLSDGSYYTVNGAYPGDFLALTIETTRGGAPAHINQGAVDLYAQVIQRTATEEELNAYITEYMLPYLPEVTETET